MKYFRTAMSVCEMVGKLPYLNSGNTLHQKVEVIRLSDIDENLIIDLYFVECDEYGNHFQIEYRDERPNQWATPRLGSFWHETYSSGFESVLRVFREFPDVAFYVDEISHTQRIGE